jgi:DNA invertase Pin-like site-specific DNA recombinase
MKIIGYIRVSDTGEREGERFIAPAEQRDAIERFIGGKRHELVDVVEDMNESGGSLDRPGLTQALERLHAGEADGIAVAYLSRLSRRVLDGLQLAQRLRDGGHALLVADLDLDTSTPAGKAMLGVALAFAELELDTRRNSWAAAQLRAIRRGVYPGSTPTGFTRDPDGRMIVDPVAGPAVARLFERRAAGASWAELARELDLELPRDDGTRWRASTVADLVTTPMYVGRLERTIGGELVVVDGAHEPLIPRSLWETVVNGRQQARGPSRRAQPAVLAGLLSCAYCGGPMSRGSGGRKRGANGQVYAYDAYVCLTRCDSPAKISVPRLDRYVLAEVLGRLADSRAIGASRGAIAAIADAERRLEVTELELDAYLAAVSAADVGAIAFAKGARERRERVDAARRSLAAVAGRERAAGPSHVDLADQLPEMDDRQQNAVLRTLVERVVVEKAGQPGRAGDLSQRVRIVWRGDDAAEDELGGGEHVGRERSAVAA